VVALRTALEAEIAKRDAQAMQERDGGVKALEALLVKHELPDMAVDLHLAVTGGTRYACRARVKTGFGLEAVLDLDVPAGNLFDKLVRVDRLAERLDIQAPEIGGWLHKEVKRKTQHLEKLHISDLSIGPSGATVKLRVGADGTGTGFDVVFSKEAPLVRVTRIEQQEASTEEAFDVDDADAKKLLAICDKLAKAATELIAHRKRLIEAKIDGEPMRAHAKPTLLVERLIATMAPVVQEIAARSQSPDELVLRRLLSGDRREEIFMSKSELKAKLEHLIDANRTMFDPLWIQALPAKTPASDKPAAAAAPHAQNIRYRPGTPAHGSPLPVGGVTPPPTAVPPLTSTPHAPLAPHAPPPPSTSPAGSTPPPIPITRSAAADSSATDMRRTLIGATAQTVEPADSVSKTPVVMMEPPREVAGTIEIAVAKAADPANRH
jgi:hypothetical protein